MIPDSSGLYIHVIDIPGSPTGLKPSIIWANQTSITTYDIIKPNFIVKED
jgi:hypothetical protein